MSEGERAAASGTERDAHWAAGSNTEPVPDGIEEVSQDPNLFADEDS